MKSKLLRGVLCLLLITVAVTAEPPPRTSSFFGTATLDGGPIPDGTEVSAEIAGVELATGHVFTSPEGSAFRLDLPADVAGTPEVEGGVDGQSVDFRIAGAAVPETGTFQAGAYQRLDLTAAAGADLAITKDDGQTTAAAGDTLTYTLTITNDSSLDATGVEVADTLPPEAGFVAASDGGTETAGIVTWPAFDLVAGASVTRTVTAALPASFPAAVEAITNTATVGDDGSQGLDPDLSNNTATDADELDAGPDLAVTKTDGLTEIVPGDSLTYTLTVANHGTQDAGAVELADTLPADVTFFTASDDGIESSPGLITWPPFDLAVGETVVRTIQLRFDGQTGTTSITNSATATPANGPDLDPTDNTGSDTTAVRQEVDLTVPAVDPSLSVTDPQSLEISGAVTVEVANLGTTDALAPFDVAVFEDTDGDGLYTAAGDNLLGIAPFSGIPSGGSATVDVPVLGTVAFRDNRVYAVADSGEEVAEFDETNNVGHSGTDCVAAPVPEDFDPVVEMSWPADDTNLTEPLSRESMSTPIVVQLTDDNGDGAIDGSDVPDIVFVTANLVNPLDPKLKLRAIRGGTGRSLWLVDPPVSQGLFFSLSGLAAGDIDGDGIAEIIVATPEPPLPPFDGFGNRLTAYEHTGQRKWSSAYYETHPTGTTFTNRDNPTIADLDGDGTAEIVVGGNVLNANGSLRWAGSGGQAYQSARNDDNVDSGAISIVADLDLDGVQEVVAGNTAYRADGSIYWQLAMDDGYPAVGNFDADDEPEIAVVARGRVRLHEHDGTLIWGPVDLPGTGSEAGGAPTVADFDADGEPEIGVAGSTQYAVFETDGTVKWQRTIQDGSSNMTGSTVFDLDGDGRFEVIYRDETHLRIYRGADGVVLFEDPFSSFTANEMPVVADVDGDGRAEIVVTSDLATAVPAPVRTFGLRVYGDANDNWVGTRRIWNQHAYHIDNVNDDGTIPAAPLLSWLEHNTFRANRAPAAEAFDAPDLTASRIVVDFAAFPALTFTARLGNGGLTPVLAGAPAAFYDGDPAAGGELIAVATVDRVLAPGDFEDVTVAGVAPGLGPAEVWVVAGDDGGGRRGRECDVANNVHSLAYDTQPVGLWLTMSDGVLVVGPGEPVSYTLTVTNASSFSRTGVALADTLPPHTSVISSDGGTLAGDTVSWPAFDLAAGAAAVRTLTLEVDLAIPGTVTEITNSATVADDGSHGGDPTPANNSASDTNAVSTLVADAGGPYQGDEGATLTFDASGSFDRDGTITSYVWDLDDDGVFDDAAGVTASHVFPQDGSYTVRVQVTDDGGEIDVDSAAVTVSNVAPAVDAGPDQTVGRGDPVSLAPASFSDPGPLDVHTATVDWGDGTVEAGVVDAAAGTVAGSHVYAEGGLYAVEVCVTDDAEETGCDSLAIEVTVVVCDPAVVNPPITVDDVTLEEGNAGTKLAVFTVRLAGASQATVSVDFATADSTARVADGDYQAVSGSLEFVDCSVAETIAVPIAGDTVDEPSEAFLVNLSAAVNGVLADAQAVGTITNDDFSQLSITRAAALERDGVTTEAVFTVTLSLPSSQTVQVNYASSDGSAVAGADYAAASGTLAFPPGTTSRSVAVEVFDDDRVEHDEIFYVDLSAPTNARIDNDRGVGTIIDNDRGRYPVVGTDVLYSETFDFQQGRFLNLDHDVPDQLELTPVPSTFPNIWVAASARGTIVKVDTRTGTVLGEYSSNPDAGSSGSPNPSRTTVGLDGSMWAGNRGDGSVIHIGLLEEGQCVDRNGNGLIETSNGYGDVLAWPNAGGEDSLGGVATAADECILHYVKVAATGTRHLSVDRDNNVWVSGVFGRNDRVFQLLDRDSGAILRTVGPMACGGYGGLIDRGGVLWSATVNGAVLRWDPAVSPPTSASLRCIGGVNAYGLGIDGDGDVWVSGIGGDRVWEIPNDGSTVRGPYSHGSPAAQGIAVAAAGDVWVSSAKWGDSATVGHLRNDGTFVGQVTGVPRGSSGVVVDAAGKIWTANTAASSLSRIDPLLGPVGADGATRIGAVDLTVPLPGANPYNYSDMTGSLALANTDPLGAWTVIQDAGFAAAPWGEITWNQEGEGQVPAGSSIVVEARAADTQAGLGGETYAPVESGVELDLPGRFIQVRATLRPNAAGDTPVLSDIRIKIRDSEQAPFRLAVDNATVFESDSGALDAVFHLTLSAPSAEQVSVAIATVEGSATASEDYTPRSGTVIFPPGTTSETVTVSVLGDTDPEDDELFFLELSDPQGATLADALGVGTIVDDDLRQGPVEGDTVFYTSDEDFDLGSLFNAHHDAPASDQLQVTDDIHTFPFIWVAGSGSGTIIKIDTRSGAILGHYSSNPDGGSGVNRFSNPSRTTVGLDGSLWAGNRGDRSIVHIGLVEQGQCVDRNGNGVIETSTGYGNVLPWPNTGNVDSNGGVDTAQDECILHYIRVQTSIPRHVSVDRDGNIWISGHDGSVQRVFELIDGQTGEILRTEGPFACGGYGGLVDRDGIVWSVRHYNRVLRWDPSVDPPTSQSLRCIGGTSYTYGIALGNDGDIYVAGHEYQRMYKIDGETLQTQQLPNRSSWCAQGLAVDSNENVWVSSSRWCNGNVIGHYNSAGVFIGHIGAPRGSTGVAVDSNGKIWAASDQANQVFRIDPEAGPLGSDGVTRLGAIDLVVNVPGANPYNYSDMTGAQALRLSDPRGTWTVIQDGGEPGTVWGKVTWNAEPEGSVPEGASITFEARAADSVAGLGGQPFLPAENGVEFQAVGRFIEVRAILRPNLEGESPVLSDVVIMTADLGFPGLAIDDVTVVEGNAGSVVATFAVTLSAASDGEVVVDYRTVDGNAAAGADYVGRSGRLVFPPGVTSQPLAIEILSDLVDEPDETFTVDLSLPQGAFLADGQGVGTIFDDDASVTLTVSDVTVEEGDPEPEGSGRVEMVFAVTLSGPTARTVRIDYVAVDGGSGLPAATAGVDYEELLSSYQTLEPGATGTTITVEAIGDLDPEEDEAFTLVITGADGAEIADGEGLGTILDDDQREITIDDVEVEEGDDGTVDAVFTVRLSGPSQQPVTVDWATVAGTAAAGADYEAASGTVTFAAGEETVTMTVAVLGDLLFEDDEVFTVELQNPVNAILVDEVGEGTIVDDELCLGPNLLANPSSEAAPVGGEIPGWTEIEGSDWRARLFDPEAFEGDAYFFAGSAPIAELIQDVDVSAFAARIDAGVQELAFEGYLRVGDEMPPDASRFVVEYRDATNTLVLGIYDSGAPAATLAWEPASDVRTAPAGTRFLRVRLLSAAFNPGDNEGFFDGLSLRPLGVPAVTVDDVTVYEAEGVDAVFTVRLSCPVDGAVTVGAATADGTAVAGEDYLATAGKITFATGETEQPFAVPIVADGVDEPAETFVVELSNMTSPLGGLLADPLGVGTIHDRRACTRSPGYWKTHREAWPLAWMRLAGVLYDDGDLMTFLEYGGPDASLHLARQLVAARLNLAAGSDLSILPVVADADAFLALFPPGSNPRGDDRRLANAIKDELDAYNNLHCGE